MAKTKAKAAEVETEETTEESVDLSTKVNAVHEGHARYIKEKFDVDVDPLHIFLTYSTRVAYRKTSDEYQQAKAARQEAREAAEAAKEEAKAKKAAEREEAKAAKAAEKAEKAKAKKAKQTAAEALAEADEEGEEPAEKPATKSKAKAAPKGKSTAKAKKPF